MIIRCLLWLSARWRDLRERATAAYVSEECLNHLENLQGRPDTNRLD